MKLILTGAGQVSNYINLYIYPTNGWRWYSGFTTVQLRGQSRPGEGRNWVRTRVQRHQSLQLKPCPQLSVKPSYEDVTGDEDSHLTAWQGERSLWLYYATFIYHLFCSFPFFLPHSVVLRAALIAAWAVAKHPGWPQWPPQLCLHQRPQHLHCLQPCLAPAAHVLGWSRVWNSFPHLTALVNFSLL